MTPEQQARLQGYTTVCARFDALSQALTGLLTATCARLANGQEMLDALILSQEEAMRCLNTPDYSQRDELFRATLEMACGQNSEDWFTTVWGVHIRLCCLTHAIRVQLHENREFAEFAGGWWRAPQVTQEAWGMPAAEAARFAN